MDLVATIEPRGTLAVASDGTRLATTGCGGLRILDLASGKAVVRQGPAPDRLAWSPDGRCLAAAVAEDGGSLLLRLDPKGQGRAQVHVKGRISCLRWRNDEDLLAMALETDRYRFGTRLVQRLWVWGGQGVPDSRLLDESPLMPGTAARRGAAVPDLLAFAVSPLGDEIAYTRLVNPPALPSRLRLELFPLDAGKERDLADLDLARDGVAFSASGSFLLYGDGTACRELDPWGDRTLATYPLPGRQVAVSPSGRYRLLDGQLYAGNRRLAAFPPTVQAFFPRVPGCVFLREGGHLYRLSGLPDGPEPALAAGTRDRLRRLRRWRAEALISAEDYRRQAGGGSR
jgi:hypothetical protein